MCDSSDFLDIKEYSRELGEVIYPNVRKNQKHETHFKILYKSSIPLISGYLRSILTTTLQVCLGSKVILMRAILFMRKGLPL